MSSSEARGWAMISPAEIEGPREGLTAAGRQQVLNAVAQLSPEIELCGGKVLIEVAHGQHMHAASITAEIFGALYHVHSTPVVSWGTISEFGHSQKDRLVRLKQLLRNQRFVLIVAAPECTNAIPWEYAHREWDRIPWGFQKTFDPACGVGFFLDDRPVTPDRLVPWYFI